MTGLERLRKVTDEIEVDAECDELHRIHGDEGDRCNGRTCFECQRKALRIIADQIEREQRADCTTVSAYDLLPRDERDAIAWVREHGGLDAVEKRLMPDGMEWPMIAGNPVLFGDEVSCLEYGGKVSKVSEFCFQKGRVTLGVFHNKANGTTEFTHVNRCEWPAPKVLDADGVEIRVGDTVYDMVGDRHEVKGFGKQGDVLLEFHNDESLGWRPSNLTHRAPVLAADGMPLREGETVWQKQTGKAATVKGFDRMLGEPCAVIDSAGIEQRVSGKLLTHERPETDSWELLEEDCSMNTGVYTRERMGIDVEKVPAK